MRRACIVTVVFIVTLGEVLCVDPWNVKVKPGGQLDIVPCKCDKAATPFRDEQDIVGDVLYKKLLQLILSKSKFKENYGVYDGSTCFHIPQQEFGIIRQYANSQNRLTASQMRRIDGILSERICTTSIVGEMLESIYDYVHHIIKHYWFVILLGITILMCCFVIYKADWSKVSIKQIVLFVFFVLVYLWEVHRTIEEAENEEFIASINKCTYDFIFWKFQTQECFTTSSVSKLLQHGNPVYVIPNIFSKLFIGNITMLLDTVNKFILKICANVNVFYYTPVYITLNIVFFGIIIFMTYAIVANYFFNQQFSLGFLFFNMNIKERSKRSNRISSEERRSELRHEPDKPPEINHRNDENVANLIHIVKDLINTRPNVTQNDATAGCSQRSAASIMEGSPQGNNSKDKLNLKPNTKEKNDEFTKSTLKKVSSVPDILSRHGGGGDSIR